ncbi:MAG: aminotransferase class I/II-fold pyridoxal phosphate-dependent enzyme [Alphaproteobacteria bacterium]|nr:aminotransferase class I/II-fold pyridoxal phosphate-dependent enzyme [Alphaproteobacteria bacterium]
MSEVAELWPRAARRAGIAPFYAMEVMRAANRREAEGAHVLHLEVGEPSRGAPEPVLAAARRALEEERIGYTEALGLPQLRARIAAYYGERYGTAVAPEQVVTTVGASGAFILVFLAAFDAGQRVALAEPCYPAYRNILAALGIEVVPLASDVEHRFQPTIELLEAAGPLDGLVVASPSNPTGTMLAPDELATLAAWCEGNGVRLISDEIYHGITYGREAASAVASARHAVVVNSFSKYFAMTGWRLGWMVLPQDLVGAVDRLAQNLFVSPAALPQYAALAAFDCREALDGYVADYASNRALLFEQLPRAGFDRLAPADGAFYIYADISGFGEDSQAFSARMLEEVAVAATPGIDFDPRRGRDWLRFSFAGSTADIAEAAERLVAWRR